MSAPPDLTNRCGSCARFVRPLDRTMPNGEVRRAGECLLAIWPPPLYETNTCNKYVMKGTFHAHAKVVRTVRAREREGTREPEPVRIPEELLDMDADEFRSVLKQVLREELGLVPTDLAQRFRGGEIVLVPGKEGTAEKRVPIETFFHKIVMVRDKLRVLEQKINTNALLADEDKVQMQQYVTQIYGSLTTFNVLFSDKDDAFSGQKSDD